jgi:hypothetical protein
LESQRKPSHSRIDNKEIVAASRQRYQPHIMAAIYERTGEQRDNPFRPPWSETGD